MNRILIQPLIAFAYLACGLAEEPVSTGTSYDIEAVAGLTLSIPVGEVQAQNLFRTPKGEWKELPNAQVKDGVLTFRLDAEHLHEGRVALLLGRPEWLDLNDDSPPEVIRVLVNGNPVQPQSTDLGWVDELPKTFEAVFEDAKNPIDPSKARCLVNGREIQPDSKSVVFRKVEGNPKSASIVCSIPEVLGKERSSRITIVLLCDDYALDESDASVSLSFQIARPPTSFEKPAAKSADGTAIFVDSIFKGYENVECLLDGKLQAPNTSTAGVSWASKDSDEGHWVCFQFPKPREFSGLKLFWANWKDTNWTSRRFEVMTWTGTKWQHAVRVQNNQPANSTSHKFETVETDRILIFQPSGGGHEGYQGIFWMTEVEFLK
ncbi:MAG: discoidin domain-containing protein [Planctomycetota bacterium]|nr:discoidin domain-containing protein [Planctomycetota bacterium]